MCRQDAVLRAGGLASASAAHTLTGQGLRDLAPVSTRPRRLSLQDAFTSQICPPGLPGVRPTSISATGEDLLSHLRTGASGAMGMFDSAGTPRRPMLRARRTSAPVGAASTAHGLFNSIADITNRSGATDWFTRPAGETLPAMPSLGIRRMSEAHSGPHLSPRKSMRLDTSLQDIASRSVDALPKPIDNAQYAHLRSSPVDVPVQDPFAADSFPSYQSDALMPSLQPMPAPGHRTRRQSDTDLLSGRPGGAALGADNDLEGLRQLLSTDAATHRQALSASLPPRIAGLDGSQLAQPGGGSGAVESKPAGLPHSEGVGEALDGDRGMRCLSYSFPSTSPPGVSPVSSPAAAAWNGTDESLEARMAVSSIGMPLADSREGSGSDFGDIVRGSGKRMDAFAPMQHRLVNVPFRSQADGLTPERAGYRTVGMQRSLSARETPTDDGMSCLAAGAAGSCYDVTGAFVTECHAVEYPVAYSMAAVAIFNVMSTVQGIRAQLCILSTRGRIFISEWLCRQGV